MSGSPTNESRHAGWWSTRAPDDSTVAQPKPEDRRPLGAGRRPLRRTIAAIAALSALAVVTVLAIVMLFAGDDDRRALTRNIQRDLVRLRAAQFQVETTRQAFLRTPERSQLDAYLQSQDRVSRLLEPLERSTRELPVGPAHHADLRRLVVEWRDQVDQSLRLGREHGLEALLSQLRAQRSIGIMRLHNAIIALQSDEAEALERSADRLGAARILLFGVACGLAVLLLAGIAIGLRYAMRPAADGEERHELRRLSDGLWLALAEARDKGEALTRAESRYGRLFDLVSEGVLIGQDRSVAVANEALARMLGYAPADMVGMPLARLVAPEDLELARERHLQRLDGRDVPTSYEIRLLRADGTTMPCHVRVVLIEHEGRPAVLSTLTDLSAISGATQQLVAKTTLLEVTFAAMSQGISVLGPDLRFRGGNDRIPGMLNAPKELFGEGSGFIDVARFCAARGDYGPGDPETLAQRRMSFLMSSEDGMSLERETGDGRIFDARHAKLPDGGWVITYSDVTEERRNTRALAESEERLRQVMDNAVDAVVLVNDKGIVESVNHACRRIFGYAPEEVIGHDVIMLMTEEEGLRHAAFLQRHIRDDEPLLVNAAREMQGRHKDGHVLPLEVSSGEFMTGAGRRMFVGLVRDLTERKAIEARLRQSQKLEALGQLTGGVAHDFNNLLAAIMSGVEHVMDDLEPGSEAHGSCEIALKATEQAAGLTRHLLAFARQQDLAPARIEPAVVVEQLSGLLRSSVPMAIELAVRARSNAATCVVDRTQLETALLNLVVNARDAIDGTGTITVKVDNRVVDAQRAAGNPALREGRWVAISVADSGAGMPSDIRHRIFEPFFTTKEPGKGTGLGLSMVHGFVLQSGGFLEVDSAPGRGTAIRMHFPMAEAATRLDRAA